MRLSMTMSDRVFSIKFDENDDDGRQNIDALGGALVALLRATDFSRPMAVLASAVSEFVEREHEGAFQEETDFMAAAQTCMRRWYEVNQSRNL